jgi:hypothetical protein
MGDKMKTESIAEFLARGGKINMVAAPVSADKPETMHPVAVSGHASIISTDDADLYHGEKKVRKAKKKSKVERIDISLLPEELRKRYIDPLMEDGYEEEDHDEEEE